jgi:hypothetical protein
VRDVDHHLAMTLSALELRGFAGTASFNLRESTGGVIIPDCRDRVTNQWRIDYIKLMNRFVNYAGSNST